MAFSDWDIVAGTTSAVLNSGLSNPLPAPVGGNFSRLFSGSPAPSITNNKPEFVNIPSTKAIRMSFCMRRLSTFSSGFFGGVRVKATTPQSNFGFGQGYGLMMRSGASGQIVLRVNDGVNLTIDGLPTQRRLPRVQRPAHLRPVGRRQQVRPVDGWPLCSSRQRLSGRGAVLCGHGALNHGASFSHHSMTPGMVNAEVGIVL